jgi:hypothetical protein
MIIVARLSLSNIGSGALPPGGFSDVDGTF